ncbi:chitobiase/beta-hexosaminidase C-terminal domain-containing protein [Anaerovorax odorimutans]|uniref:chitobiase/beta-hexosaminidase C-terminal domain-containing protein n=1 Tax=Anaerovorax odorimutans TaxID=109327 RepID=UPI0004281A66|nr:chitobiase/beta-hexosaminidase C-terminal domain-containing protein [Anaerovorax odorimutans]
MKKSNLIKVLICVMVIISMISIIPGNFTYADTEFNDDDIVLTISGDGVEKTVDITLAELKALPQVTYTYSGYNHWPSLQVFKDTTGPTLQSILAVARLKDNATIIKFETASGGYADYTVKELLKDERYYYPDGTTGDLVEWPPKRTEEGKKIVPTILGLSYKDQNEKEITLEDGKLCYGQRSPLEPTACKSEQMNGLLGAKIKVMTQTPKKWDAPHASIESGTVVPGTKVKLQHGDGTPYGALVYYTLDGSEPTVKSNIANISYPYFQPALNAPIPITEDVTIKTRTIGLGKLDSDVATYEYNLGELACTIEGEGLIDTTKYALETLKQMTPETGTYKTLESEKIVELNGKGVFLETLLNKFSVSDRWKVKYISTDGKEYDGGTVAEVKNHKCLLAYEVNGAAVEDEAGEATSYIQILRNYSNSISEDNRLKNITTIKLVSVDDEITINSVRLINKAGNNISSVAAGGCYRIEAMFANNVDYVKDALLIFQVRNGDEATALNGGKTIGYVAMQTKVPVNGGKALAEFTMPSGLSGNVYVDVLVWNNAVDGKSLGKASHDLSFNIE